MDQTNEPAALRVEITTRDDRADIVIDGVRVDPRAFKAYSVTHFAGEHPEVLLHVVDRSDSRWSGMARVSVADHPDPGPVAAAFFDAIDPEALERAALARPDLGSEPFSLTKSMLAQLTEWARGL